MRKNRASYPAIVHHISAIPTETIVPITSEQTMESVNNIITESKAEHLHEIKEEKRQTFQKNLAVRGACVLRPTSPTS